jgi:hypothetical protein
MLQHKKSTGRLTTAVHVCGTQSVPFEEQTMTKEPFFASLFELSTVWVDEKQSELNASGAAASAATGIAHTRRLYVEFLVGLFNEISRKQPACEAHYSNFTTPEEIPVFEPENGPVSPNFRLEPLDHFLYRFDMGPKPTDLEPEPEPEPEPKPVRQAKAVPAPKSSTPKSSKRTPTPASATMPKKEMSEEMKKMLEAETSARTQAEADEMRWAAAEADVEALRAEAERLRQARAAAAAATTAAEAEAAAQASICRCDGCASGRPCLLDETPPSTAGGAALLPRDGASQAVAAAAAGGAVGADSHNMAAAAAAAAGGAEAEAEAESVGGDLVSTLLKGAGSKVAAEKKAAAAQRALMIAERTEHAVAHQQQQHLERARLEEEHIRVQVGATAFNPCLFSAAIDAQCLSRCVHGAPMCRRRRRSSRLSPRSVRPG